MSPQPNLDRLFTARWWIQRQSHRWLIAIAACFLNLAGCNTIAPFDQAAYAQTVSLKVETLALIDKASGSYGDHAAEIGKLNLALAKGYEYDKNRPRNDMTRQMWEVLLFKSPSDPRNGILARFYEEWKDAGSLKKAEIENNKKFVGAAFDKIIQLESGKIKTVKTE